MTNILQVLNYIPNQIIGVLYLIIIGFIFFAELRKSRTLLNELTSIFSLIMSMIGLIYFGMSRETQGYSIGMMLMQGFITFSSASYMKSWSLKKNNIG